jgi:tubulin-folding cofactor B
MLSAQASADIPLLIKSADSGSERRINPSWSVAHLKTRLEPITGIPAAAQKLSLRFGSRDAVAIEAADEENTQLSTFPLQAYAEIFVSRNFLLLSPTFARPPRMMPLANK